MPEPNKLAEAFTKKAKFMKPECEHCQLGGHGFICYSKDGSCLLTGYKSQKPKTRGDTDISTGSGK